MAVYAIVNNKGQALKYEYGHLIAGFINGYKNFKPDKVKFIKATHVNSFFANEEKAKDVAAYLLNNNLANGELTLVDKKEIPSK